MGAVIIRARGGYVRGKPVSAEKGFAADPIILI
jgi:hypothetical protein